MPGPSSRIHRISHWIGIALATPIFGVTALALVWWFRGEFPSTVTIDVVVRVIGMMVAAAILVYAVSRAIGWAISAVLGRTLRA